MRTNSVYRLSLSRMPLSYPTMTLSPVTNEPVYLWNFTHRCFLERCTTFPVFCCPCPNLREIQNMLSFQLCKCQKGLANDQNLFYLCFTKCPNCFWISVVVNSLHTFRFLYCKVIPSLFFSEPHFFPCVRFDFMCCYLSRIAFSCLVGDFYLCYLLLCVQGPQKDP